jgi:glycosyltransferase involved in cell wall biosynthesis
MNRPLVSVVMPVCNSERFLAESIDSILGQTFKDFEFVIVDFGSTDNSKSIVSKYATLDSRVKFHQVPPCTLPAARNAGCFLAQGRYIAIMDADDVALPDRLAWEVDYMEKHPHVALLGGAVEWINSMGQAFETARHPTADRELKSELVTHCVFWHPTILMRQEAFVSVGGYRTAFVCAHDYDLELRISENHQCANLEQVVLKYRFHPSQLTFDKHSQQTLCKLAARASAAARNKGLPDPLDAVQEITPSLLATLGIGKLALRNCAVTDARLWIRYMIAAGDYAAALTAARRILESDLDHVEPLQVSELYLLVAGLYRKQGKFWKCFLAVGQAVLARPMIVGRPLKPLLHRLGLAS